MKRLPLPTVFFNGAAEEETIYRLVMHHKALAKSTF